MKWYYAIHSIMFLQVLCVKFCEGVDNQGVMMKHIFKSSRLLSFLIMAPYLQDTKRLDFGLIQPVKNREWCHLMATGRH